MTYVIPMMLNRCSAQVSMASSHQASKDTLPSLQEQITHIKELLRRNKHNCAEVCATTILEADENKRRQQKDACDQNRLIEQLLRVLSEEKEARVSKIEESVNTGNIALGHIIV